MIAFEVAPAMACPSGRNVTEAIKFSPPPPTSLNGVASGLHNRTVRSSEPDAKRFPAGLNATDVTDDSCPWNGVSSIPFQTRTVPSTDPEATVPSEPNATELTLPSCPQKVLSNVPESESHIRTVPPVEPEATVVPSSVTATDVIAPSFAIIVWMRAPETPSHIRM